jgi:uncharacterized protein YdaU (DUF1376 family)
VPKLPYFPFYPQDFLGDPKVMVMSTLEVGAYIKLLCVAWLETPVGSLSDRSATLQRIAGMSATEWDEHKETILAPFDHRAGRYYQKRMVDDSKRLLSLGEKRSLGAQKTNEKRWGQRSLSDRSANHERVAQGSVNHNQIPDNIGIGEPDASFPSLAEFQTYGFQIGVSKEDCETLYREWEAADWCTQEGKRIEKWRSRLLIWRNRNILPSQTKNAKSQKLNGELTRDGKPVSKVIGRLTPELQEKLKNDDKLPF